MCVCVRDRCDEVFSIDSCFKIEDFLHVRVACIRRDKNVHLESENAYVADMKDTKPSSLLDSSASPLQLWRSAT